MLLIAENLNYFTEAIKCSLTIIKTSVLSQPHIRTIQVRHLIWIDVRNPNFVKVTHKIIFKNSVDQRMKYNKKSVNKIIMLISVAMKENIIF